MLSEYSFTSHFLDLESHKLHYIDEGEGPVVVMVHGNPTWSYFYRNLIDALRVSHRVIALDHLGCGFSDKPADYNYCLAQHIQNLNVLLDSLGIDKYSMVVHDWGGAIGLGAALENIEVLEKMVLFNTAAFRSKRIPLRIRICKWPVIGEIIIRLFNGFAWPATFMAVKKKMNKEIANGFLFPYNNWHNRIAIHNFVADIPMSPSHPSYNTLLGIEEKLELLQERNIPMLFLWGGKDFCFNDSIYLEWKNRFPDANYMYFKDGGHYVLEDKKEQVIQLVRNFFLEKDDKGKVSC